jgi:ribosomal protein S12 methylthiotransferase
MTKSEGSMNKAKVGIISLGCARNLVDSEVILGRLRKKGYPIVDIAQADIGIINTCAFIKEAKEESLQVMQEVIDLKKNGTLKKIVVTGCLPQRYHRELVKHFKEIDAFAGRLTLEDKLEFRHYLLTEKHFAYVKICESCSNRCSYCVIPKIKGAFKSRSIESVIAEVRELDKSETREINLIGQDTTSFGRDLSGRPRLAQLLQEITGVVDHIKWVRLLYTYPSHFDDRLIELIAKEERLCKYVDLPLQHINDRILKSMNRRITKKQTLDLIARIRKNIPGVAIRTSLIVGFPGETDKDFRELLYFMESQRFERLGVFMYSREEGTPAYHFAGQVPEKVKQERLDALMSRQQDIAGEINQGFLGREMEVLIDEVSHAGKGCRGRAKKDKAGVDAGLKKDDNIYLGRTQFDAPEVDGLVYVHSKSKLKPGDFARVKITDTLEYDLVGEKI